MKSEWDILHPIHENEFFFAHEFVVFLPDFLIATGLVDSRNNVKKLIANKVRITLLTHNLHGATFAKMRILEGWNHFTLCESDQIMLGNNILKIRDVKREHACEWKTMGFDWEWTPEGFKFKGTFE